MLSHNHILQVGVAYGWFSVFSAFCSGLVVITGFLFPKQIMSPSRPFSHMIFFISLCDCFGSIGGSLGLPAAGTPQCTAQGFLLLYFYPASWIWTTLLVYQIRCLLVYKRLWLRPLQLHLICWTIVSITAFIPLTTNAYGQDDDLDQEIPCNFAGNPVTGFYWSLASFGCILLLCAALMFGFALQVMYNWYYHGKPDDSKTYSIYKTIRWYPVVMLVCWLPYLAWGVFQPQNHFSENYGFAVVLILSSQYGTFLTLVFFWMSPVAIRLWKQFFGFIVRVDSTKITSAMSANKLSTNVSQGISKDISCVSSSVGEGISSSNIGNNFIDEVDDFDDERLLYICSVSERASTASLTMNALFVPESKEFRNSQFDESMWSSTAEDL